MPWRFFSGVTFVLFCFVFRLYDVVEAAALRSIVLRYAGVPIATRDSIFSFFLSFFSFFLFFVYLEVSIFPSIVSAFFVWRVRRTFFPSGWCFLLPCDHGLDFYISLCENSINQSINAFTSEDKDIFEDTL